MLPHQRETMVSPKCWIGTSQESRFYSCVVGHVLKCFFDFFTVTSNRSLLLGIHGLCLLRITFVLDPFTLRREKCIHTHQGMHLQKHPLHLLVYKALLKALYYRHVNIIMIVTFPMVTSTMSSCCTNYQIYIPIEMFNPK